MEYTPHAFSDPALSAAVELMFDVRNYLPDHPRERLVPDGRMHLVFELDGRTRYLYDSETGKAKQECTRAWLSGVHSNYITIGDTDKASQMLAIQFAPGRSTCFTHRSASEFCDMVVPAAEVFGDGVLGLREALLDAPLPEGRLALAEEWLQGRMSLDWSPPAPVEAAVKALLQSPADLRWTQWVADNTNVSYKHFLGLFRRHVGPAPKVMQRIVRFSRVFQRLQASEALSWAELSLDLGYADQAHFVREFTAFSGYRPSEFLREGHDRVNFFPDEDGDSESNGPGQKSSRP